ncbi:MAG: hypothetical protein ACTS8R_03000 [Arsenophonus sp. NC-QC1-MAG3]
MSFGSETKTLAVLYVQQHCCCASENIFSIEFKTKAPSPIASLEDTINLYARMALEVKLSSLLTFDNHF